MTSGVDELKSPRLRLPERRLLSVRDGASVPLRSGRREAAVLILVHDEDCPECRSYLDELARREAQIREWDGRVVVVVTGTPTVELNQNTPQSDAFPLLMDDEQQLASALSVDVPAVVVADQWGEIHLAENAGPSHRFVTGEEVVQWVKFLAVQCPECQGEAF